MKKVLIALKDDLSKEIERANSESVKNPSKVISPRMSRSKLTAPVHLENPSRSSREQSPEQSEKYQQRSRMESRQSQRLSRARSRQKEAKLNHTEHISSQQCELNSVDVEVGDPFLDIAVVSETNVFGCGEFGLKEYILDGNGGIEEEYFLIDNQVILDVHQDFNGRVVFTNPDESSVYMINGEDVVFVTQFNICKSIF